MSKAQWLSTLSSSSNMKKVWMLFTDYVYVIRVNLKINRDFS
jgi:hypothetical protein